MAEDARERGAGGSPDDDLYAATRLFEPENTLSREEEDIAFAAQLLNSGLVNDREISAAVSDWSMHGSVRLAQHIERKSLLTAEQIARLQQQASARIDRARRSIAAGSQSPSAGKSMMLATLERLDGSGRVAKLFGVTLAASGADQHARVSQGRYEIIRKLGQGGLGRVWLARDTNLNRHVALKEISHAAEASSVAIERFRHEAEITGRLDHPSIVPIYQLGEDADSGRVFYTMRFLGRSTLQDSISEYHERREAGDDDPMLLRHLLTAFVSVCHAIGHAHSRKVIHRDLKPENVVIDSFGQVIVIDWGLAKVIGDAATASLTDSAGPDSADRTSEGQVLGTPLYMAPEQAAGRLDELDHRTDIYGLGAILFAIVTGYAPHEKTQREAIDSGDGARGMISAIAAGAPPAAHDANADADPVLEAICRKAMARRRYARYQAAAELAEDVQKWMAGEPVSAYQETNWQRASRWVAQHQRMSQSLLAAAIVALVALTTLAMSARQSRLAAVDARYSQLVGDVREVELQLEGIASELSKDARFIASLPPIQGIVNARNGVDGDDEQVWRTRLETIFSGMLRSNPDYLALSYEAQTGEGAQDVVRVERNPSDRSLVRVLPASRLKSVADDALMSVVGALEPGDVRFSLAPRARRASAGSSVAERLSVATPVYNDATGELFGMAVIETDVAKQVADAVLGLGAIDCEIFVADGEGQLLVSADADRGVRVAREGESIPDLPAAVQQEMAQEHEPFDLRRDGEFVAQRFYVDPTGRGLMIFGRLPE
ncbi:Serine/threonine-protein kinase PknD [Posidoniimonas corsicana]|uniref:Serine/threonine-protein kinase PknD n=1 Tax=Posidoniimonas corsicana TaxID=1938618 RepID=A0A5C5VCN0_9BACT|nr:serine/threonine-protein kinase [Posidoniimonas corsicana]TWT36346.1 Serine/threonine-protein kinase PknD [Posidoniimonas corsicana]